MSISAATFAKIAASLAQDKNVRKVIGAIIGIIIGIIILIIGVFFTIANSLSIGSHDVLGQILNDSSTAQFDAPAEYAKQISISISEIKTSFAKIENALEAVNDRLGDQKVDVIWAKSVFYALYFEQPQPSDEFFLAFSECFVTKTTVEGNALEIPQADEATLFQSIGELLSIDITDDTIQKAKDCYTEAQTILTNG